jgi:lysophospholipase L1-like esterase
VANSNGTDDGEFVSSPQSMARKLATGLLLAASGSLLAIGLLWIVDRLVVGRTLATDDGLVLPPGSRVIYQTDEFRFTAEINRLGFRGREFTVQRVPGRSRVLAIGDSFTYGWGVELDQTWPKRLQQNLRHSGLSVEVANLGKVAASPMQYAQIASRAIPELHPDLVIVGVVQGDDLEQLDGRIGESATDSNGVQPSLLERATTDLFPHLKRVLVHQDVTSTWGEQVADLLGSASREERARFARLDRSIQADYREGRLNPGLLRLALWRPDYFSRHENPEDPDTRELIARMAAQLERIGELAEAAGARVIVVSVPSAPYVNIEGKVTREQLGFVLEPDTLVDDGPDESIRLAAKAASLPFVSVTDAFRRHRGARLFFPLDGHLTEEGHDLLADRITPAVEGALAR